MDDTFFSDRTSGPVPRTSESITPQAWRGLVAVIRRHLGDGSLARAFPIQDCIDGPSLITGTSEGALDDMLLTLVPGLRDTVEITPATPWGTPKRHRTLDTDRVPPGPVVLDIVDFVLHHVARPSRREPHDWFKHEHLHFGKASVAEGRRDFASEVELIFQRNGIAYTVGAGMKVERLAPVEARDVLAHWAPATGDGDLDAKLRDAVDRFASRDPATRADGLEKLWDAYERLKTLELGGDKRKSLRLLIDRAVPASTLADRIEGECAELTKIGNDFQIRHFEHGKHPLPGPASIDYLFTRLAALTAFLLRETGRM